MLNIGEEVFYEKINLVKLKYIINNPDKYKQRIESERRHKDDEKQVPIWSLMKNISKKTIPIPNSEYGFIPVTYKKGSNSNGLGRWYADKSIGLAPLCSLVRHTICDDLYYDIDQVNSHVNIMNHFINKFELKSPSLDKCINEREETFSIVMKDEECDRCDAKTNIISCLNGKNYKTGFLKQLGLELMPCMNKMVEMDEYIDIYKNVKRNAKYNYIGKTVSKILQVVENDMLESYLDYCISNDLITKYKNRIIASLVFDGFQLDKKLDINCDVLNDMRKYTFEKTGYDVPLKLKDMDNKLEFPEDYNEAEIDDEDDEVDDDFDCDNLKSYEECKKEFELTHYKILHPPSVYTIDDEDDDKLQNMKNARETYGHLQCYVKKPTSKNKKTITIKEAKNFINKWLLDPDIKFYKSICWKPPPLIANDNMFNTWNGFSISDCEDEDLSIIKNRDYFDEFLKFVNNLYPKKEEADYIISRYAYRLQNPSLKSKICCVYFGEEEVGKSTLIAIIYKIFGKYAIQIQSAKQMYKEHSTVEKEKLLVCVNEVGGVANFENSEILKTRVTEDTLYINPKGIQAYEIDNFADYDMTTNNVNVIKNTDESKRRWFQVDCSNYYAGNDVFFKDFYDNIVNNPFALRKIYEGLMNWKCSDYVKDCNFQKYKPVTELSKEVRNGNRCKITYFIIDELQDVEENTYKIDNKELFRCWYNWCSINNVKNEYNAIQFGMKVSRLAKTIEAKLKGEKAIKKDINNNTIFDKSKFSDYISILTS